MRGLFVTGTDTGVGKTFVTAALARLLLRQGHSIGVCKPVASGASRCGAGWLAEDTRILAQAVGMDRTPEIVTPFVFPAPAAPTVAAREHGVRLQLSEVAEAVRQRGQNRAALLVEGVGGLLCPLAEQATVADLIAELRLPVVVVARQTLGTLNHTLLTVEVARRRGLNVAGVVVSAAAPPQGLAEEQNVAELRRLLDVPLLAAVPFQTSFDQPPPELEAVDWWRLCGPAT